MIGRRAVAGVSLLCALAFCALGASSASAVQTGTTAFTCEKVATGATFADAHCDTAQAGGAGFKHKKITAGVVTEKIKITNDKTKNNTTEHTPWVFKDPAVFGSSVEIICTHLTALDGALENQAGEAMKAKGSATLKFTECNVPKPGVGEPCDVEEPIEAVIATETMQKEAAPQDMGVETKPLSGTVFTKLKFIDHNGKICPEAFKKEAVNVEGTATGTPGGTENGKGATLVFTKAMTEGKLKFGGTAASIEGTATLAMYKVGAPPEEKIETENAIILTTPPYTE